MLTLRYVRVCNPAVFLLVRCVPVYQRSSVQILTQFTARDAHSRTTHHLGSSDWFVDVTELVHNWLRVEDPRVASLGPQNILIGLRPGKTSLHVGDSCGSVHLYRFTPRASPSLFTHLLSFLGCL